LIFQKNPVFTASTCNFNRCSLFFIFVSLSGTGTSCIYPLIALRKNPTWSFTGVDVDVDILKFAKDNVSRNSLHDRIKLVYNSDSNIVFPQSLLNELASNHKCKFFMCNPPFFSSMEDAISRKDAKPHQPLASGNEIALSEAVHRDGGELGFIRKLIVGSQSVAKENNVRLFSCLVGLKETFLEVIQIFQSLSSYSFAYDFIKISHTCRWVIFWSFTDSLPSEHGGRLKISAMASGVQIVEIDIPKQEILNLLSNYGSIEEIDDSYMLTLCQNKWSRRARRSGPESLIEPLVIEISFSGKDVILYFETNSNSLWDIFIGFINHLRKAKQ
jgi:hypothetical protein